MKVIENFKKSIIVGIFLILINLIPIYIIHDINNEFMNSKSNQERMEELYNRKVEYFRIENSPNWNQSEKMFRNVILYQLKNNYEKYKNSFSSIIQDEKKIDRREYDRYQKNTASGYSKEFTIRIYEQVYCQIFPSDCPNRNIVEPPLKNTIFLKIAFYFLEYEYPYIILWGISLFVLFTFVFYDLKRIKQNNKI